MYLQYIDGFRFPPPPPPEATIPESPLFCPRTEFFTLIDIREDDTRNRRCKPHTYELLIEMRDLTNHFYTEGNKLQALETKLQGEDAGNPIAQEENIKQQEDVRRKFQRISARVSQHVNRLHSASEPDRNETNDWFYESIRLCSVVYTHALTNHQPFSTSAQSLDTTAAIENGRAVDVTYPRAIMLALVKAGIDDCWADMAGVLFWITLVGAAAGRNRPQQTTPTPPVASATGAEPFTDPFADPFSDPSLDPLLFDPTLVDPLAATELGESSVAGSMQRPSPTASSVVARSSLTDEEARSRAGARKWLVALAIRCSVLLGFSHGVPLMGTLRNMIRVQRLLGWGGRRMSASPW